MISRDLSGCGEVYHCFVQRGVIQGGLVWESRPKPKKDCQWLQMVLAVEGVQWTLSRHVRKRRWGMFVTYRVDVFMTRFRCLRLRCMVGAKSLEKLIRGTKISARGKVRDAADNKRCSLWVSKVTLFWSLSLMPKERMTFWTSLEIGVLYRMRCAAWARLAPG